VQLTLSIAAAKSFIGQTGTNALFHYNAQQTWSIDAAGRVRNVLA
jgi:sulfane dehydrogenase subunit SoxC